MVPVPAPVFFTVTLYLGSALKVAVTFFAAVILIVQVTPLTLVQPFQVTLVCKAGSAVRVTTWSFQYDSVQSPGQLIPVGLLVTAPVPAPVFVTVSAYLGGHIDVAALTTFESPELLGTSSPLLSPK